MSNTFRDVRLRLDDSLFDPQRIRTLFTIPSTPTPQPGRSSLNHRLSFHGALGEHSLGLVYGKWNAVRVTFDFLPEGAFCRVMMRGLDDASLHPSDHPSRTNHSNLSVVLRFEILARSIVQTAVVIFACLIAKMKLEGTGFTGHVTKRAATHDDRESYIRLFKAVKTMERAMAGLDRKFKAVRKTIQALDRFSANDVQRSVQREFHDAFKQFGIFFELLCSSYNVTIGILGRWDGDMEHIDREGKGMIEGDRQRVQGLIRCIAGLSGTAGQMRVTFD